jgi:hypothetical protein
MLALGEGHLNHLIREYVGHFHTERPYQTLGNRSLPEADSPDLPILQFPAEGVAWQTRFGGLLRHYRRAA